MSSNRNRVSTKSQIGASSVSSGRCVKIKMPHFLNKKACFGVRHGLNCQSANNRLLDSRVAQQSGSIVVEAVFSCQLDREVKMDL